MSKRIKWLLVIVISAAVWVGGVWYMYRSYNTPVLVGPASPSGYRVMLGKELRLDPKTGKYVEKSFLEVWSPGLVLLTVVCGGAVLFAIIRLTKRRPGEDGSGPQDDAAA